MRVRTCHIPSVSDYETARAAWEKGKPWRDDTSETAPRDLGHRRKRHMSVRKTANSQYVFRLYYTDVATYNPDGTITVRGYDSASTNSFVGAVTPFRAAFPALYVRDYLCSAYNCVNTLTLEKVDGRWRPTTEPEPWRWPRLNKARGRAALEKHNYQAFAAWLKACVKMGREFRCIHFHNDAQTVDWLAQGPDRWPLLFRYGIDDTLEKVRQSIYRYEKAFDVVEHESVFGWRSVKAVQAAQAIYY